MAPRRRRALQIARATRRQILLNVSKRTLLEQGRVMDVVALTNPRTGINAVTLTNNQTDTTINVK